jgi:hypothetical protein
MNLLKALFNHAGLPTEFGSAVKKPVAAAPVAPLSDRDRFNLACDHVVNDILQHTIADGNDPKDASGAKLPWRSPGIGKSMTTGEMYDLFDAQRALQRIINNGGKS